MPSIPFTDHLKPDKTVDWQALHTARRTNGETCTTCGRFIWPPRGHSDECGQCQAIPLAEELRHSRLIRCPRCRHAYTPEDADFYELFNDGEHAICCGHCGHDFTVNTSIAYVFTSPALIAEPKSQDEPE